MYLNIVIKSKITLVWHFDSESDYTAKSGYKPARDLGSAFNWKIIWKLEIPPKVNVVLWRCSYAILPTMANFLSRHIPVLPLCPRFGHSNEDLFLAHFYGEHAQPVWIQHGGWWSQVSHIHCADFSSVTGKLMELLSDEDFDLACLVLWSL